MSETQDWTQALPFDNRKQTAILGHLLSNQAFFMQAKECIRPSFFNDPLNRRIWDEAIKFYKKWQTIPSQEELMDFGSIRLEDPKNKQAIHLRLKQAFNETAFYKNVDVIKEDLSEWLKSSIFYTNMHDTLNKFNKAQFREAYQKLKTTTKLLDEISFENDQEADFSNFAAEFAQITLDVKNAITFGLPVLDRLLVPQEIDENEVKGGLFRGDTTVLLAPTNVGKTTTMISVIRHNLIAGKSVLFLTHEGRPTDIKQKLWCSIMGCTKAELVALNKTPEGRAQFSIALKMIQDNLVYIPYNKPGMTVEEVEAIIRRKNDERIAKTGKGFDLLVDDYPAKLTTVQAARGNISKRERDEIVYDYFVQLALELGFHSLVAIQTNRTGSKINSGQEGANRLLTKEDVAESWGVMNIATNVITINRDSECKRLGRLIFYIDKSRSSETGLAIITQTDYPRALTHDPSFLCTWYHGSSNPSSQLNDLLEQYSGKSIPDSVISKVCPT